MFFVLDVLALIIFFGTIISCYHKGFFKAFFGTIKVIVSVVVAYLFMPTLSYFFRTKFIQKTVSGAIEERVSAIVNGVADKINLQKLFADMPTEFADILNRYGADTEKLAERYGHMTDAAEENVVDLAQTIAFPVVKTISDVLSFIAIFILAFVVLTIAIKLVSLVLKLPVLSGIDKFLGFVLGLVSGAILLWVYCNVVSIGINAFNAIKPGMLGNDVVENTFIIKNLNDFFGLDLLG